MSARVDCGGGVGLERGVPCRMADGVTLYADHYYPPQEGRHPTLLMRQPYGRDIASTVVYAHPAWFARRGYNVVIQDVRGRGDSEGEFYPFRYEGRDGADTIAAIRRRPEANGQVGMYGFSYQGITQLLAAAEQPEGLQCIAPAMTAHDLFHGWFYHHGALRLASTLGWGLQMLKEDARRRGLREASKRLEDAWAQLPVQSLATPYAMHPALHGEGLPSYVSDWIEHDEPGAYWASMDLSRSVERVTIPALHLSGWYDLYLRGSVDCFVRLRSCAGTEHARKHQYLLAGPWVHIPWGDRIGAHPLGVEAAFDTDAFLLRWFDHWLKGTGAFAEEPLIRHFVLNLGRWESAEGFPLPTYNFYLHSGGRANSSKGDGVLSERTPETEQPPDLFLYDPEVPVLASGGIGNIPGPVDQRLLEAGNNVLVYTAAPLAEALDVFGSPEVSIYFATSASYADMVAKLVCVRSTGEASLICMGVARSTYLFKGEYSADTARLWQFALEPTSWRFSAGDRVRLEIASSAYPLYDRNPGTPVAPHLADSWNWQRSTQMVYHDPDHRSRMSLPVVDHSGEGNNPL